MFLAVPLAVELMGSWWSLAGIDINKYASALKPPLLTLMDCKT